MGHTGGWIFLKNWFYEESIWACILHKYKFRERYYDYLLIRGQSLPATNPDKSDDFKTIMTNEFEITDIGQRSYFLGVEFKQNKDDIFIS